MVTLAKTWSGPNQTAFTSAADQNSQYAQGVFAYKSAYLSAGWTVERSSNGTVADGNDNWNSVADIVHGTEASQAHAWIVLVPPAGKGNPSGGSNYRVVLNCNVASATTTPQGLDVYVARGSYSGGSTTTRPSVTGTELTVRTWFIIPWNGAIAGSFCIWYTTDGDVFFATKANGDNFFRSFTALRDDPVDALGNYTLTLFAVPASTSAADIITAAQMQATTGWRGMTGAGALLTTVDAESMAWSTNLSASWTNGAESTTGRVPQRNLEVGATGAATGRVLGLMVDCRAVPQNATWMTGDINDDGNANPFQLLVIGDIMIPCDSAIS